MKQATFNPETVATVLEIIWQYEKRPLHTRKMMCEFARFQESIGNISSHVVDVALYHVATGDAERAAECDPFIAMIEAERMDQARAIGMYNDVDDELFLDFDRMKGSHAISEKWCARAAEITAAHLQAWGQSELADQVRKTPDLFRDAYDVLYDLTHPKDVEALAV